jgi:hypothetical protein
VIAGIAGARLRFLTEVAGLLVRAPGAVSYTGRVGESSSPLAAGIGLGDAREWVDGEVL